MTRSNHAKIRMQQRGFSEIMTLLIYHFGEDRPAKEGRIERTLSKKSEKRLIQNISKCSTKALVLSSDGETIVTAYNR